MSKKLFEGLKWIVVLAMLIGPSIAFAQQEDGMGMASGPENAMPVDGAWRELNPGEVHWYAFQYDGRFELQEVEDGDEDEMESVFVPSDILVWADSTPDDGINFGVWTQAALDALGTEGAAGLDAWDAQGLAGEDEDRPRAVGGDSECPEVDGDVCWAGTLEKPGTVYLRVTHDQSLGQQPVSYSLNVEGTDVRTDTGAEQAADGQDADAEPDMDAQADMDAQQDQDMDAQQDQDMDAQAQGGSAAAQAFPIDGTRRQLNPGEVHWYAFQYDGRFESQEVEDGDEDETESVFVASDILVWADSIPDDSINFTVWTRNNIDGQGQFDVDNMGTDLNALPQDGTGAAGADAECPGVDGDVCWKGTFQEPGTYYVRVSYDERFGPQALNYVLHVEGADVRTDMPGQ